MNPPVKDPAHVFIVGCGDVGRRVGRLWREAGIPVTGLARSEATLDAMTSHGITPRAADLDAPQTLRDLPVKGALLYHFAPPPPRGQSDTRLANLLEALTAENRPRRIVLLSTSGVYGDHKGARVDETTPPSPGTDRGRRRLDAEQRLLRYGKAHGVETVILRVGGIYGPGRLPEARLRQRVPMVPPEQAPVTNRIHVDDLARIGVAAARRGRNGEIYNVCDGTAGNMTDYFDAVADFLGLPRPPRIDRAEAERTLSPGMVSYLRESRRLDNRKMREELGVELRYPDLASGLRACRVPAEGIIPPVDPDR
ncbi:MAG TPA: SDR family oxidoreductase [Gammaproteobacteria bacterium]|nr:SDR family oxidoreductase [Gammaproteobacteria bacterium]